MLPQLVERTGTDQIGSITAFYTVLVDGDDMDEPIADAVRGLLDGHFVLDRTLAEKGQFPAINVLKSVSRLMQKIVAPEHLEASQKLRNWLAIYEENKELIQIGAYQKGASSHIDEAVYYQPMIMEYLYQSMNQSSTFNDSIQQLLDLVGVKGE